MLPSDDIPNEVLGGIFDDAYNRLVKAGKDGTDHDSIINAVLTFVEHVIPKILRTYKGQEYEDKCKTIAVFLRITISTIMPIEKFLEIMSMDEMKGIDAMVRFVEKNQEMPEDAIKSLFKKDEKPKDGIYQ